MLDEPFPLDELPPPLVLLELNLAEIVMFFVTVIVFDVDEPVVSPLHPENV